LVTGVMVYLVISYWLFGSWISAPFTLHAFSYPQTSALTFISLNLDLSLVMIFVAGMTWMLGRFPFLPKGGTASHDQYNKTQNHKNKPFHNTSLISSRLRRYSCYHHWPYLRLVRSQRGHSVPTCHPLSGSAQKIWSSGAWMPYSRRQASVFPL